MPLLPTRETQVDNLHINIFASNDELGQAAAEAAEGILRRACEERGTASVILASGNSQLSFLRALRASNRLAWEKIHVFHMDEWLHLPPGHPARFDLFMHRELIDHVRLAHFYPVRPDNGDAEAASRAYERLLREHPADLCMCGIGENGHLAFNDPPYADFDDPRWVKVVEIDTISRQQQVGEGHFAGLEAVPKDAISLTIPALLAARQVLCLAPEARKANIVARVLTQPISEDCPATVLRRAPHARLYLDQASAASLT